MERREDGFHPIESVFIPLDFGDTLSAALSPGGRNSLSVEACGPFKELARQNPGAAAIPSAKNLVFLAAELFCATTGFEGGFEMKLVKRVPAGSGLGGGSSDAAFALKALNTLAGCPLDAEALSGLAAALGSDVPFFLDERPAWVSGRGETIEALPALPALGALLVFPGFFSDTAAAYRLLDEERRRAGERARFQGREAVLEGLESLRNGRGAAFPFHNDFLPLFLRRGTAEQSAAYREILAALEESGSRFAGLSGSGSACFGVYPDAPAAEKAEAELAARFAGRYVMKSTFFLARSKKWMYDKMTVLSKGVCHGDN
ncbi:MAG: 4-(cytidine 5'-diphospho)-2-C-methyl-D-erythritol kinase [Treponema sp.]|nr:4-(cytidine 5'-diphospho)-2-C-methyl-D-erythritol kinase [Treponema sp.]